MKEGKGDREIESVYIIKALNHYIIYTLNH